jgi:phage gp16-like protein
MKRCRSCGAGNRIPQDRIRDNPRCGRCKTELFIPGTVFLVPEPESKGRPQLTPSEEKERRGLLAKIHVAKKQMGLNEGEYEMILRSFRVTTAADLTISQLENMVTLLKRYGWKPEKRRGRSPDAPERLEALRARCRALAGQLKDGEKRVPGLIKKICGVENLAWCRDSRKLTRLLAALEKIVRQYQEKEGSHGREKA